MNKIVGGKVVPFGQNDYKADVRMAFVDYVEHMHRSERISDTVANSATLE